jgi:hypothetical protein
VRGRVPLLKAAPHLDNVFCGVPIRTPDAQFVTYEEDRGQDQSMKPNVLRKPYRMRFN